MTKLIIHEIVIFFRDVNKIYFGRIDFNNTFANNHSS